MKNEEKVAVGTSSGAIALFNEKVLITGGEDGWIRVVGLYPHAVNLFQKHAEDTEEAFAIAQMDMSHDETILASISHDCSICFYDLNELGEQIDDVEYGEKLELEEDQKLLALKDDMNKKAKNKDKQQKKLNDKKKNLDFFSEF